MIRCAIYTRKSHEEGLEQEFNSLDAQRLSAENYIKSQQHEGWQMVVMDQGSGDHQGGDHQSVPEQLYDQGRRRCEVRRWIERGNDGVVQGREHQVGLWWCFRQLIKPTVIETLSIGWLRAMTRRRDDRRNSRIVRGWVMDNRDRNERQRGTANTRRQVG